MNRDHWKQILPIITHFAEGGEVQYNNGSDENPDWQDDLVGKGWGFHESDITRYRIKPAPRLVLRTSDDTELVWLKHLGGRVQFIIEQGPDGELTTCSWRKTIQDFHKEGYLCSATRNGPWLPLVKEEIV